jgi:hypothetical protein
VERPEQNWCNIEISDAFTFKCIVFVRGVFFFDMRTTVTLSEAAAELVQQYAEGAGVSLSRAVSDLVEQGARKSRVKYEHGIPVLDIPGARRVTSEEVRRFLDEEPW